MNVLVIDVGGTHVKILATGQQGVATILALRDTGMSIGGDDPLYYIADLDLQIDVEGRPPYQATVRHAIAGMDARQNRRLVMRQLLVIRQVAPEIPDRQPDDAAAGDRQQHDADE